MMKKILILCMTFICILSGCRKTDSVQNTEQKTGYKQVSMEEGLELMKEDSGYILLDIRRTDELKRTYSWINQYSQWIHCNRRDCETSI